MLQGLAILMMLYHHLFSTPEALGIPYKSLLSFGSVNVELRIAWFFKICVGIYAFVSGYGLCRSFKNEFSKDKSILETLKSDYKIVLKKLLNLYLAFWLVFIIFMAIGFIFFNKAFVFKEFILNFLGISNSYNGAWWYMYQYLKMVLLLPVFDVLISVYKAKKDRIVHIIALLAVILGSICLILINKALFNSIIDYFQPAYYLCFLMGFIIARFKLYELFYKLLGKNIMYILGVLGFIAVIAARIKIAKDASSAGLDFIFVPVFVYGFLVIVDCLFKRVGKLFSFFGKYSTFIWLTHVFFYDHYAKKLVMATHFSTGIYLTLVIMSLITAIILSYIFSNLLKIFKK